MPKWPQTKLLPESAQGQDHTVVSIWTSFGSIFRWTCKSQEAQQLRSWAGARRKGQSSVSLFCQCARSWISSQTMRILRAWRFSHSIQGCSKRLLDVQQALWTRFALFHHKFLNADTIFCDEEYQNRGRTCEALLVTYWHGLRCCGFGVGLLRLG